MKPRILKIGSLIFILAGIVNIYTGFLIWSNYLLYPNMLIAVSLYPLVGFFSIFYAIVALYRIQILKTPSPPILFFALAISYLFAWLITSIFLFPVPARRYLLLVICPLFVICPLLVPLNSVLVIFAVTSRILMFVGFIIIILGSDIEEPES